MRVLGLISLVLTVGCVSESDTLFTHQGQIMAQARGVVLSSDGQEGMAGMYGTTCVFNAQSGQMGADFDLDGDDEVVEDSHSSGIVLTRSSQGIHEIAPYGGAFSSLDSAPNWQTDPGSDEAFVTTEIDGVIAARWLGHSPVVLTSNSNGCAMQALGDLPYEVTLNDSDCQGFREMIVRPDTQDVFIGTTAGVTVVSRDSASEWSDAAISSMSWDPSNHIMYVSTEGGLTIQALNSDGVELWSRASTGVTSLTHLGPKGAVSTMENDGAGRGLLSVFDGVTGDLIEATETPASAHDMSISENGATLAIAVDEFIHLFSVR